MTMPAPAMPSFALRRRKNAARVFEALPATCTVCDSPVLHDRRDVLISRWLRGDQRTYACGATFDLYREGWYGGSKCKPPTIAALLRIVRRIATPRANDSSDTHRAAMDALAVTVDLFVEAGL